MTDYKILEALKEFMAENVASKFKLERPPEDGDMEGEYKLVHPAVYIGWIPPKNYLNEYGYDVPALLVMEDGGEDTGDEASIQIRIGIATYDPGMTNVVGVTPNSKGYRDLLNIITRIRIELAQKSTIKELTVVEKPIKWGLYEEQSYPYWHGWISFSATTMPLKYSNQGIEKYL